MTHRASEWVLLGLVFATYGGVVVAIVAGWVRWAKSAKPRTVFSMLSLLSFALATASALVAISSVAYAQAIGGFQLYDRRLTRIFRWGFLLSASAILLSTGGVVRRNPLRYYAPACSLGTLVFWVVSVMVSEG